MKEKSTFPDRGPRHAILITLFYGRRVGKVVTNEDLRIAIAEEYGVNPGDISDETVSSAIGSLRKTLQKFAPEYEIKNRIIIEYEIVKNTDIKKDS